MGYGVVCSGDLSVRQISEVQSNLTSALEMNASVVIEMDDDARPDVSFLQLIEAARIQARLDGKTISLAAPAKGALLETLTRAGFLAPGRAQDAAFWLHGDTK